jgi:polyisoprenoid-binding protein YceI
MMNKILLLAIGFLINAASYSQNNYLMDKNHSKLSFSITDFGVAHVNGVFKNFDFTILMSKGDFTSAVITMTADVNSISTGAKLRDKHLLNSSWFEAEKYPEMIFKSNSIKKDAEENYRLEGKITIRGITKQMVFDVVCHGKILNSVTNKNSVRCTISGKLNRQDFALGTEALALAIGNEVDVKLEVEFVMN